MEALVTGGEAELGTEGERHKDAELASNRSSRGDLCHPLACLPIVWPGVDREVPSGDGWKGCWTLVRMIL